MTQDHQPIEFAEADGLAPAPRRSGPGPVVMAGVVAACALGAGLGLWARPTDPAKEVVERPAPTAPPRPAALQIVIADEPAPIGPLLEVLPGDVVESAGRSDAEVVLAHRAASGLVKVDAPIAPAPLAVTPLRPEPEPRPLAAPGAEPKANARDTDAEAARKAKADAEKARLAKLRLAEAKAAQAKAAKAKADAADKATRLAKVEKEKAAKAKLAKAEAEKARKAEQQRKLAAAAHAVKKASKTLKDDVRAASRKKTVEVAAARPKSKPQAGSPKPATKPVETAQSKPPSKRVVAPRGEGPVRIARANPCAGLDPAEAAVCADPRLSARERQLQRAYRDAEAAGVPAAALRRQQARWQQTRAAVARDAPWAVEDVYVARISELHDLTRDAREN